MFGFFGLTKPTEHIELLDTYRKDFGKLLLIRKIIQGVAQI